MFFFLAILLEIFVHQEFLMRENLNFYREINYKIESFPNTEENISHNLQAAKGSL